MKEPKPAFLIELAKALKEATHVNVAEHLSAGLLFALYPEWWDINEKYISHNVKTLK